MDNKINTERLARLMAAFESGEVPHPLNPFDSDDPMAFAASHPSQMVTAFAALVTSDTPRLEGMSEDDHNTALAVAGLVQGMWIGWEYAQRDELPAEGA